MALPPLPPLQRPRHGPLGHHLLRARLHLLALVRPGRAHRRPGDLRLRPDRRGDRRDRRGLPAPRRTIRAWLRRHERHPLLRPLFAVAAPGVPARDTAGRRPRWPRRSASCGTGSPRAARPRADHGAGGRRASARTSSRSTRWCCRATSAPTPLDQRAARPRRRAARIRLGRRHREGHHRLRLASRRVRPLVLVARVVLAARRRPVELVVLLAGFALIYAAVHLAKAGIDRPRPAGPLVETRARRSRAGTPPTPRSRSRWRSIAHARLPGSRAGRARHRRRSCSRRRSGCRASTCARTTGRTSRAAGRSAPGLRPAAPRSRWSSRTCATMTASAPSVPRRAPSDEPGPHHDRDRDRAGRRRRRLLLRGPDRWRRPGAATGGCGSSSPRAS